MPVTYLALFALLLAFGARAQPNGPGLDGPGLDGPGLDGPGLGAYQLGVSTPEALPLAHFSEQAVYVKGTIALSCNHVRVFTADSVNSGGMPMTHLTLFFYDNRLFKLTCDYTDAIRNSFGTTHGHGTPVSKSRRVLCEKETDKPLILWGELWQHNDVRALVLHADGYGADCQRQQTVRLTMASQPVSALSSDCDLTGTDPIGEAVDQLLNDSQLGRALPGRQSPGLEKP